MQNNCIKMHPLKKKVGPKTEETFQAKKEAIIKMVIEWERADLIILFWLLILSKLPSFSLSLPKNIMGNHSSSVRNFQTLAGLLGARVCKFSNFSKAFWLTFESPLETNDDVKSHSFHGCWTDGQPHVVNYSTFSSLNWNRLLPSSPE